MRMQQVERNTGSESSLATEPFHDVLAGVPSNVEMESLERLAGLEPLEPDLRSAGDFPAISMHTSLDDQVAYGKLDLTAPSYHSASKVFQPVFWRIGLD